MRSICFLVLTGALFCASSSSLMAQAAGGGSSPFTFTGNTRVYGQASNRQGLNQALPASFVRWELSSLLTAFGIPISMNALVTSEQANTDQQMNYFNIGLSQADLQGMLRSKIDEKVTDLEAWKEKVQQEGLDALRDSIARVAPEKLR